MTFVRDIWTDLVDKRLWPVALALVIALVAIPALLLEPAAAPKPPPPAMADAGPAPLVTDPAAIASARPSGPVVGEAKNPFAQQHVPKKDDGATPTTSGDGPGTTTASSAPSSGQGGGGKGPGSSGGGGGPSPAPRSDRTSDGEPRIRVRFGPSAGRRKLRTLSAGMALPSATNPTLVFVDVGRGGRVEFIVSSDAVPQGDGTCKPSKSACAQLFMRRGDTEFFDVTRASGRVVQYQLDVIDVVE